MRTKKPVKPTEAQASWLKRIAESPMMKTYIEGEALPRYSLQTGVTIPYPTAIVLIRNGWVKGRRDSLFDDPQAYVALTP